MSSPRVSTTRRMQILLDLITLVFAFAFAYLLRFDFAVPQDQLDRALIQLPVVISIQLLTVILTGMSTIIWRYVGIAEIQTFARAALLSSTPILLLRLGLPERFQDFRVPLSIIVMDAILAFGGLLGLRVLRRVLYEAMQARKNLQGQRRRVLVVGAGDAGVLIAKEIRGGASDLELVGLVDDNPGSIGATVSGARVLGTTGAIGELCAEHRIDEVILAFSQASRHEIRRVVEICEEASVEMRIIPSYHEVVGGAVEVNRLREVRIEDLLGREPIEVDESRLLDMIEDQRVMVTGAGGSIGSEIARQIERLSPQRLLLVERSEAALFEIHRELSALESNVEFEPILADIGDEARMRAVFSHHRPSRVYHAAAHKHVPMVELNCAEAIRNNTLGTQTLGQLASEYDVESFVLISTDKAIRPTSVMGASKRLAELAIQHLDKTSRTKFMAVRFGNVMGSAGSVIPIFSEQIKAGGPVTVTHPEMERYFMTIPEASRLVLQASAIGEGGDILFLDMGEPIRILDLARDMITLSGLKPEHDIPIEFVGTRPGEKLYEELEHPEEKLSGTSHPKVLIAHARDDSGIDGLARSLAHLGELADLGMEAEIRETIGRCLPESHVLGRRPHAVREPESEPSRAESR
ncbi:MAG: nucleoside-diphosphate sugar epimerase/dehydratase [Acidobacteriota bacterium]